MEKENHVSPLNGDTLRDRAARGIGTLSGAIPIIGPIVQLIISELIPNQRLERIESFLRLLADKVSEAELKSASADPKRLDVLEEGITQATRSLSEERQQYIATLVARGLAGESAESARARHFMRILSQIDDSQIVLLCSYKPEYQRLGNDEVIDFFERHSNVIGPFSREIGGDPEEHARADNKDAMLEHLAAFGLLKVTGEDWQGNHVEYEITPQGQSFLDFVGLGNAAG